MESKKGSNIVIIGGTACGPKAAARARRCDPRAKITLIEQAEEISTATCGMPYYISGVISKRATMLQRNSAYFHNVFDIDVLTGTRAMRIDRKSHVVELMSVSDGQSSKIKYDKLVLATGSLPAIPNLEGKDLKGIVTLSRLSDADAIHDLVAKKDLKKVVIIGAGLIGIEMVEAFSMKGLNVTLIEALDCVLPALLDKEIAYHVEKHLKKHGIDVITGQRVTGFEGNSRGWVKAVNTADRKVKADIVLMALGVKPNIGIAKDAGITIGKLGGIVVDEFMQTNDPDIYAGGDCVENINLLSRQPMLAPMGSTANKHGRVIGTNITGGKETFPGVLGTAIAKVFDYNIGRTGFSESAARADGYDVITSLVPGVEHATYYPEGKDVLVKLIVDENDGTVLGGQVAGPGDAAKRVDVLATALTFGCDVNDLADLDLAYAPPYNSAFDPLHHAANVIRNQQAKLARPLSAAEVKQKLDSRDDLILLDVRSQEEYETSRIDASQTRLIPLPELRSRMHELPKDAEIIICCKVGVRAYQAQRILEGAGYKNVAFFAGSISAWPYDV